MTKRKIIIFSAIFLVIFGIIMFIVLSPKTPKGTIDTKKVVKKDLIESISSSGKTKAKLEANLKFQTSGKLAWVGVKEGDIVSQYQTIASLDVLELQKNLDKALRDYSKERNDFDQDKIETYRDIFITNTVRRILEKNQWDLEKAVMDVELKDIALRNSYLVTPIAGIVTSIDSPVAGVNITASSTFTVVDPTSIVFSANVDEVDVGKLQLGQIALVNLDAFPDNTFNGTISKIAYAAQISAGGATVFPVEISFIDSQNLRVGLNGDVTIELNKSNDVLTIDSDAVRENGNTKYVIKKINNNYIKVIVKTGILGESDTAILEGVSEGDELVTKGFSFIPKTVETK